MWKRIGLRQQFLNGFFVEHTLYGYFKNNKVRVLKFARVISEIGRISLKEQKKQRQTQ